MSTEQHKQTVRRFFDEVVNQGNLGLIDQLLADNFVDREEFPGIPNDRSGVRAFFAMVRSAFPDLRAEVKDIVAEGDRAVARSMLTGTQQGEFMGIAPTGKPVSVQMIDVVRFDGNGKVVEHWGVMDQMTMMQQLGAIPA